MPDKVQLSLFPGQFPTAPCLQSIITHFCRTSYSLEESGIYAVLANTLIEEELFVWTLYTYLRCRLNKDMLIHALSGRKSQTRLTTETLVLLSFFSLLKFKNPKT